MTATVSGKAHVLAWDSSGKDKPDARDKLAMVAPSLTTAGSSSSTGGASHSGVLEVRLDAPHTRRSKVASDPPRCPRAMRAPPRGARLASPAPRGASAARTAQTELQPPPEGLN